MRIFRATSTAVVKYIEDKVRPADGVTKEQYLENLAAWLTNAPDTLLVNVIISEESKVIAFMVCYLPPGVDFIFISQVWAEKPQHAAILLVRAIEWGDSCNRTQVRMETESDPDGYLDTWKFDTITITKAKRFEDMTSEWITNLTTYSQENSNGISSSTSSSPDRSGGSSGGVSDEPAKDAVDVDSRPEGHLDETGGVLPGPVPSIHGQAGA